jgi:3-hydroxyacyl-CoA dehydrogenase
MSVLAQLTIEDGVAFITMNNPPVNALSAPLRRDLQACLQAAFAAPEAKAIVLICAGRTFIAGADIAELGKPPAPPTFPELFVQIEDGPKPVIAAIHGTALGGGFELVLVCHYRIAAASVRVGLPEVLLGVLPGAGGTQRVPRLAGVEAALEIMTSGRQVGAQEALTLGLVDAVVEDGRLREEAFAFARDVIAKGAPRPRIRDRSDRIGNVDPGVFDAFSQANAARFRGFKAPQAIVEAVRAAVTMPFEQGLAYEQQLFEPLVQSRESEAQRYIFFSERETARVPGLSAATSGIEIGKVGVVGAGTMGGGITMNFLDAGLPVTLVETNQAALDRGLSVIRRNYERMAKRQNWPAAAVEQRMALVTPTLDLGGLEAVELVIEAVFESMEVKQSLFAKLDRIVRPSAILASNTSFLDIDRIASATARPECVIGLHFFSPANIMRLLEVVRGERTASEVIATAMALARRIGKVPVLSRVCPGFIANRLLTPRGLEAERMVLEGTPVETIDNVLTGYGFAMGHFRMMDLVGLDVIGRDAKERTAMGDLVAAGRLGQKQGGGYYDYDAAGRATPSAEAARIIASVAGAQDVPQQPMSDREALLERLLYPVVNEGAKILEEGIALRASDIDVAAVLGYNWPVVTGGPMFWAQGIGLGRVVDALRRLEATHGERFRPADLLISRARDGEPF